MAAPDLNIIPIIVVAETQNKAEMLNGLLRNQGLAVHPVWASDIDKLESIASRPELIFYFMEDPSPALRDVADVAEQWGIPVLRIEESWDAAKHLEALKAGAVGIAGIDQPELLAAIVERERSCSRLLAENHVLAEDANDAKSQLQALLAQSGDAIAYIQDGVHVQANPAWLRQFDFTEAEELNGTPVMDLFASESHGELKRALRTIQKKGQQIGPLELQIQPRNHPVREAKVQFNPVELADHPAIQMVIHGRGDDDLMKQRLRELEHKNQALSGQIEDAAQFEPGSRMLRPPYFVAAASEAINRPKSGQFRTVVCIRAFKDHPILPDLGALGIEEAGTNLGGLLTPLLLEGDLATRVGGLTMLFLLNRPSEEATLTWIETVLLTLEEHIFEASGRSVNLNFTSGYAVVDRVRKLELLANRAQIASAKAPTGHALRAESTTEADEGLETSDQGWQALLQEAFQEHRFVIAQQRVTDLRSQNIINIVLPRLIDRQGEAMLPEIFFPPAKRIGMLPDLQRRLTAQAIVALLHLLIQEGNKAHVLLPLDQDVLDDTDFFPFLKGLSQRAKVLPENSLILELNYKAVSLQLKASRDFFAQAKQLGCAISIHDFDINDNALRLLNHLSLDYIRLSQDMARSLAEENKGAEAIGHLREFLTKNEQNLTLIADGVTDANTMATLYNLGVTCVQGPAVGEPELFTSLASESLESLLQKAI